MPSHPTNPTAVRALAHSWARGSDVCIAPGFETAFGRLEALCGPFQAMETEAQPLSLLLFTAELCFNAVNFCYWQETAANRPGGGATGARTIVFSSFGLTNYPTTDEEDRNLSVNEVQAGVMRAARSIASSALPLARARFDMLGEIAVALPRLLPIWERCASDTATIDDVVKLGHILPGFAGDPLQKRNLLFFLLMYRVYGRCFSLASTLPLPADYQVPNVLRRAGVTEYSERLAKIIDREQEIASDSEFEREIRATAIVAVEKLARSIGTTEELVDEWLWAARHRVSGPHHLTQTTHY